MAPERPDVLRVLLLQEGNFWVAQCIDKDIAAQGLDPDGARRSFLRTLGAQVRLDLERGLTPLENIPRAPDWYFYAYEEATELTEWLRLPEPETEPQPEMTRAEKELTRRLYIAQAVSEQHVA